MNRPMNRPMNRRHFLQISAATGLAALAGDAALRQAMAANAAPAAWRGFEVTTTITLRESGGAAQLWLPLIQTAGSYQRTTGRTVTGATNTAITRDPVFGANILHARWDNDAAPQTVTLVEKVETRDRAGNFDEPNLAADARRFWTRSTEALPTDGIVRETAMKIIGDRRDPAAQLHALYAWVVANSYRNAATPGCGTGDIKAMLSSGNLGGKCADINSLMVGLCRAAGLPARDTYGVRTGDSALFKSLGRSGDISKAQHCRAEAWLEGKGWFPIDPADVRKAVLEENLPLESAQMQALAVRLFGAWESNWVGYNNATGITLAGAPHTPNFDFLMYPCAMTAKSIFDCLDTDRFSYKITSRAI